MAYVGEPFKHDIFISYATESNDAKWVTYFRQRLEISLTNKIKYLEKKPKKKINDVAAAKLKIWFDQDSSHQESNLSGNDPLTEQIFAAVKSSATLIIIVSEHYWRSVWPIDERSWFSEVMEQNKFERNRVFIVRQTDHMPDSPTESLPEIFLGPDGIPLLGYKFFNGEGRPIWPVMDSGDWRGSFVEAMDTLVKDMASVLLDIRASKKSSEIGGSETVANVQKPMKQASKDCVFLGHTNAYLKKLRTEVRQELEQRGFTVLPPQGQDKMHDMVHLQTAFDSFLPQADIFVQLLNENCGDWPEDDPMGTVGLQLRLYPFTSPPIAGVARGIVLTI